MEIKLPAATTQVDVLTAVRELQAAAARDLATQLVHETDAATLPETDRVAANTRREVIKAREQLIWTALRMHPGVEAPSWKWLGLYALAGVGTGLAIMFLLENLK